MADVQSRPALLAGLLSAKRAVQPEALFPTEGMRFGQCDLASFVEV
jgi:hypothetical protein